VVGFDTNILIYAVDNRPADARPTRRLRAAAVIAAAIERREAFVALQVLAEFFHVATRNFLAPPREARMFVEGWRELMRTEAYDLADLEQAFVAHEEHGLPFWDALVWAVCDRAGVRVLASEDFQNGRRLGRVTFLDPFDPANDRALGLG
jgi:predicted nucleic acid-binding protein